MYTYYPLRINYKRILASFNYACITLKNGMKCNPDFYWYCVELGILNPDED